MGSNCSGIRIGIPIIGEQGWLGGITYVELLLKALSLLPEQERPRVSLIVPEFKLHAVDLHKHIFPHVYGFILKQGILVFEQEPFKVMVEPKILNEYFDFHKMLLKYGLTKAPV